MAANIWIVYAMLASVLWGVTYAMAGRLLQHGISIPTVLIIESALVLPVFLVMAGVGKTLKPDLQALSADPKLIGLMVALALSFVTANFLIASSIAEKNATLAALLEVSYPLFTFLFAWLIFRDAHLNWGTALGGAFIILGIVIIYLKN